jgi:hypothetical protein
MFTEGRSEVTAKRIMGTFRLTKRHLAYARSRAAGLSMEDAWLAVGYSATSRNWWRLEQQPAVRKLIEEYEAEAARLSGVSLARVQTKLAAVVNADPAALVEIGEDGALVPRQGLPADARAAISKVKIEGDSVTVESVSAGERTSAAVALLKTIPGAIQPRQIEVDLPETPGEPPTSFDVARRIAFLLERGRPQIEGEVVAEPVSGIDRAKAMARLVVETARALRDDREASEFLARALKDAASVVEAISAPLVPQANQEATA